MLRHKLRRLGILAVPPAALCLMATSAAKAQPYVNYFPFDTSASVTSIHGYQSENPSAGIINSRLDYYTGISAASTGWTNAANYDTDPGGGSVKQSVTFPGVANSAEQVGFTFDMYWTAETVTDISFYLQVAPGSATSSPTLGGSWATGSSGSFGVATRDAGYDWTGVPDMYVTDVTTSQNFGDQGGGFNFGDPGYSGNSDAGDWLYIDMPFPSGVSVAGLTFQDYDDDSPGGRIISGQVTWYIDDLTLTPMPVPEPACLGLLGLSVPALLARRRRTA
jgi:hypothetical protein